IARIRTVIPRSPAPAKVRYELPETLPTTRAPMPQPNPSTEMTGSIIGATIFSFHRRKCTTTLRRQTASASRRFICVADNIIPINQPQRTQRMIRHQRQKGTGAFRSLRSAHQPPSELAASYHHHSRTTLHASQTHPDRALDKKSQAGPEYLYRDQRNSA